MKKENFGAEGIEACECVFCRDGSIHDSDCAVHNEPAYPNGPCNCSLSKKFIPQEMVDRFLSWPLPKGFSPDCGVSFDGRGKDARGYEKQWPVGTNLLSADQAREMLEYVVTPTLRYERLLLSNAEKEVAELSAPQSTEPAVQVPSDKACDSVRGVLQMLRNKSGVTYAEIKEHCTMRGDDLSAWPEWADGVAPAYVTEQGAASLLFSMMRAAQEGK